MNDQPAQTQQNPASYVDDYTPPADNQNLEDISLDEPSTEAPVQIETPVEETSEQQPAETVTTEDSDLEESIEDDLSGSSDDQTLSEEAIETQNIFFMLDVEDADEDMKEKFLDQLQEVIWDEFLNEDVNLLLTKEEQTEFADYKKKADEAQGANVEQAKDKMVEYLEDKIPDLEDIMLEKALDLKADLFVERIKGLRDYFVEKQPQLDLINEAEQLMFQDKWKSAAQKLNSIEE